MSRGSRLLGALAVLTGCGSEAAGLPDAAVLDAGPEAALRVPNPTCRAPAQPVPQGVEGLPARLADTGCFTAGEPVRPVAALVPYTVNAPLWSDGAEKDRWLALPDDARIHVAADGDFELPPGTVLIKTFRLGTRPIETRFFVRHPGGAWSGYTYEWNQAGTDATLLDEGSHRRTIGDREWHFPSRAECDSCHTPAAGHSLGLELSQLDQLDQLDHDSAVGNQLKRMASLALFDAPLPPSTPYPVPGDTRAPLAARARAYLHANCAGCHRPGVGNSGTTDFRFSTPLSATTTCDAEPRKGTLGLGPDHRIITPGLPDKSMVIVRMRTLGSGRMPSVGTILVDEAGVALVSEWIAKLTGCE